jgi:hypothetical protein
MSRRKQPRQPVKYSGLSATRAEVEAAFRTAVKSCVCPACGLAFTDAAIDWGDAWREGYVDCIREDGSDVRDGPYKIKCEMCSRRSMYNVFANSVSLVPEVPTGDPEA